VPSRLNPNTDGDDARDLLALLARPRDAGTNLTKAERRVLLAGEDDLFGRLQELPDHLTFSLTFVEKAKARERILLTVDDVLPSRLRRLFEAKARVEKRGHEGGYLRDEWEFTLYRHLFPLCEVDRGGGKVALRRPDFLAILDHVFRGAPVQASYLANTFIGPLRTRFVAWRGEQGDDRDSEFAFRSIVQGAWLTWHFLDDLEIISEEGTLAEMTMSSSDHPRLSGPYFEWLEEFFAEGARTFRSDAAKVAFLLGSLADSVREVQLANLKAAPFAKYLKSLRMEQGDLLDLLPRITQKLTEYDEYRGRNRQMLEAVSYYLTRAGIEAWPMTSAEINLIFGMGMNLGYLVRRGPGKTTGADAADGGGVPLATPS
ncbi:MAG: TM1802 family CRISPR-associated protein, partial [Chloroflexota bacterium]